jgi:cytoskeleton protein RodZ
MTDALNEAAMPLMPPSPGALIKAGRERAGVHMAVLAVNLKVSIKQLEALEADKYDALSGPVFARALAAKVCRFVKIDAEPVLALMPATTNGLKPLQILGAEQSPTHASNQASSSGHSIGRGVKSVLMIVLLLVIGLVFGTQWGVSALHLVGPFETNEVVPTMPPAQETVSSDAAQTELPKAMVFDSSNAPTAASPSLIASPSSSSATAPTLSSTSTPPPETNK